VIDGRDTHNVADYAGRAEKGQRLWGISAKSFHGSRALASLSSRFQSGEVHAVRSPMAVKALANARF
jgi:hypothetical protein